jgi:nucleoid-associated protein YgaU
MKNRRSAKLRGAVAVFVLVSGLILGLLVPNLFAEDRADSSAPRAHVVQSGETLWSLAGQFGGGGDPREFVYRIKKLNGLETSTVFPGQKLILPTG